MKKYFVCLLALFISVCSYAQEAAKKEEGPKPMSCPEPYKCIEISFETGVLMSSLPVDQPVILYGKNVEKFEEGNFTFFDKRQGIVIDSGKISFDEKKEMMYVVINKYLRSNREYKVSFETSASALVKEIATEAIIDFFLKINSAYDNKKGISLYKVDSIRKEIIDKLPVAFRKNVQIVSILGNTNNYILQNDDLSLISQINNNDRILKDIDSNIPMIEEELKSLLNVNIISEIQKRNTNQLYENLLVMNENKLVLNRLLRGLVTFQKIDVSLQQPTIYEIDKLNLQKIIKNIDNNINVIRGWKGDAALNYNSEIDKIIDTILFKFDSNKASYLALQESISYSSILTTKVLESALVDFIVNSIVIEGNTIADLLTSAQMYTGADIGVMMTRLDRTPDSWRALPYLGLNLYFLPVNKRAPIGMLYRQYGFLPTLGKVTSLHFGITIPKINSPQYQGIYEFENARGIFGGIGIRPWRSIRLSAGKMLINRSVKNSLTDSFNISARNYFSISIDWEVRKIIPNIKELFTQ